MNSVCEASKFESRRNSALASIPCSGLRNSSASCQLTIRSMEAFYLRDMLLIKSDFILLEMIASSLDSSTITELVNAERYAISLSTVQTGTADLDQTKQPEYQRSRYSVSNEVNILDSHNVPPPASHNGRNMICLAL